MAAPGAESLGSVSSYSLEKFSLYETRARYYLVGRSKDRQHWRILKIDRSEPYDLSLAEDPAVYTQAECTSVLQTVAEGNRSTGGLQLVTKAYGLVGFIRFLECYYMILVTRRRQVGAICGHAIFSIEDTALVTVPHPSLQWEATHSKLELRYKKLLSGVDLTKDFFFSYTYRLMQTFQRNALYPAAASVTVETMFVWNAFLTRGIEERLGNTRWTVPLVHGYFSQARLSLFGRVFTVTLLARRSRHFAGTRYLKRGVNDKGRVANDVETEQLVSEEAPGRHPWPITSVVQNRGSIPLFWSQETSKLSPKPDIVLVRYDPVYQATSLHFQDLARRYGHPIIILNLIKDVEKRPREMILRREFAAAVRYLNQTLPEQERLKFIHWDFHKFAKSKGANVLTVLGSIAEEAMDLTGFTFSGREPAASQRAHWKAARATSENQADVSQAPGRGANLTSAGSAAPRVRGDGGVRTSAETVAASLLTSAVSESTSISNRRDDSPAKDGMRPDQDSEGASEELHKSDDSSGLQASGSRALDVEARLASTVEGESISSEVGSGRGNTSGSLQGGVESGVGTREGNELIFVMDGQETHSVSPEEVARSGTVFERSGEDTGGNGDAMATSADVTSAAATSASGKWGKVFRVLKTGALSESIRKAESESTTEGPIAFKERERTGGSATETETEWPSHGLSENGSSRNADAFRETAATGAPNVLTDPELGTEAGTETETETEVGTVTVTEAEAGTETETGTGTRSITDKETATGGSGTGAPARLQSGVLRTNCIDCLDRTNVAQYAYGLAALARQLHALGLLSEAKLDPDSEVAGILMDMYQEMGDVLALQYGGSAAHNMVFPERQGLWKATTQSRELLKTIRRYYSNAYTDAEKQDAINLFLGHFIPEEHKPALWELDTDYHLHMGPSAESPRVTTPVPVSIEHTPPPLRLSPGSGPPSSSDDPPRLKLTSFDKLAAAQAPVRHVRLVRAEMEPSDKQKAGAANDDVRIVLTGPNWLFGALQEHLPKGLPISPRSKFVEAEPRAPPEILSSPPPTEDGEAAILSCPESPDASTLEPTYATTDEDEWYGSGLLAGSIVDSPAYSHYQRLCQVTEDEGRVSRSGSESDLYETYDKLAGCIGGLGASDEELEARLAEQLDGLSNFESFIKDSQEGFVGAYAVS